MLKGKKGRERRTTTYGVQAKVQRWLLELQPSEMEQKLNTISGLRSGDGVVAMAYSFGH